MPSVRKGEKKSEFVSRCVGDDGMKGEFPNVKQRVAVCHSLYEQHKKRKKAKGSANQEVTWDEFKDKGYISYE